ncbi:MAG: hypothetical protein LBL39_03455 [Planctomycetaceae bacterium]|nr:hypothetical protein [Planctomycetaceae bacterium]
MDNPVQVKRSTGLGDLLNRNYVVVQPEKIYSCRERVELLRSSVEGRLHDPVLHFVCTGLSMLKSYGLKNHEQTLKHTSPLL